MLELPDFEEIVNSFKRDYKKEFRVDIKNAIEEAEYYEDNPEGLDKMEMLEIFLDELDVDGKQEILKCYQKWQIEEVRKQLEALKTKRMKHG